MSDMDTLYKACCGGDLKEVKRLHASGEDIHAGGDWAFREACRNGHLELVKYLVEAGADIHARGNQALFWASQYGQLEVFEYLQSVDRKEKLARLLK